MWTATAVVAGFVLAVLTKPTQAGFDFGAGCEGGGGSFPLNLPSAGEVFAVGPIPAGKWDVRVTLTSNTDVDIQLYDVAATEQYAEGAAVVAWCDASAGPCNIGALGSEEGEGSATYKGMRIGYSGYAGIDRMPGKEWISVTGALSVDLAMKAFAFEAGTATVNYTYSRTKTGCCLGTEACTGSFSQPIANNATVTIGEIPIGKDRLRIELTSEADVDIQLFESGGCAIIAYSVNSSDSCNHGTLGNNDGSPEFAVHSGLNYSYSGYHGGQTEATYGHEFVALAGTTNLPLEMRAFGYAAGTANIQYQYYEVVDDASSPIAPSIDWLQNANHAAASTAMFTDVPTNTLVVRRGKEFNAVIGSPTGVLASDVATALTGTVSGADGAQEYPADAIRVAVVQSGSNTVLLAVELAADAPIGHYQLAVTIGSNVGSIDLAVLANPYRSADAVYTSRANRAEYVENTQGLLWQGLSDNNNAYLWDFAQFEFANLVVALNSLRRMPIADRGDMALVARHLTYAIGADICYGKWGSGSYTSGRPAGGYRCSRDGAVPGVSGECRGPDEWTGTTELFALHTAVQKPVQYCQCFVYAALATSIGRALGIPTRPVTNFQSAHDTERNRAIEKWFSIDANSGSFVPYEDDTPSSDSVWSFHVWHEMYFDRPDLNTRCSEMGFSSRTCANGWQVADATPQEVSAGGSGVGSEPQYQMGPASVRLIKANKNPGCGGLNGNENTPYGCYDHEFVISEVNSDVNLWTRNTSSPTGWSLVPSSPFAADPWGDEYNTIGLQISTKKKGAISDACALTDENIKDCSADLDDLTRAYKVAEPSGPGSTSIPNSGPDFDGDGQPGRRERERRSMADVGTFRFPQGAGVTPSKTSVLVNEPGHIASSMTMTVPFTNTGTATENITCVFTAHAIDNRGVPFVGNASAAASVVGAVAMQAFEVAAGENGSCTHTIFRNNYRGFASTYMDSPGFPDMPASDKAFAVKLVVSITASGGLTEWSHTKMICTPLIAYSTRSGSLRCEGNRGSYHPHATERQHGGILYPLLRANRDCSGSRSAGNGICNPSLNYAGCWDGGDCCAFSCWSLNGHFYELDDGGRPVFAHNCASINPESCLDPTLIGYVPEPDFTDLLTPVAFGGAGGATDYGDSLCDALVRSFEDDIAAACAEPCSAACRMELDQQLCRSDEHARLVLDCSGLLTVVSSCNQPRCPARTLQGCKCNASSTCDNPQLQHVNDWCYVVPGSCDTDSGAPEYDGAAISRPPWDDCGTGAVGSPVAWTADELSRAVVQRVAVWTALKIVRATANPTNNPVSPTTQGTLTDGLASLGPDPAGTVSEGADSWGDSASLGADTAGVDEGSDSWGGSASLGADTAGVDEGSDSWGGSASLGADTAGVDEGSDSWGGSASLGADTAGIDEGSDSWGGSASLGAVSTADTTAPSPVAPAAAADDPVDVHNPDDTDGYKGTWFIVSLTLFCGIPFLSLAVWCCCNRGGFKKRYDPAASEKNVPNTRAEAFAVHFEQPAVQSSGHRNFSETSVV